MMIGTNMMTGFRTAVSAHLLRIAFIAFIAILPGCVAAQDAQGKVKTDSLQVYSGMSSQSDEAGTLARGGIVRIYYSLTNDEGSWCSVSSIDPSTKIGFVRCNGLERQTTRSTATSAGMPTVLQSDSGSQSSSSTRAQKAWGLAASAILTEFNRQQHDTLAGWTITEEHKLHSRHSMETWWNIRSREDLLNTFTWLDDGGHRQEFSALGERVSQLEPEEFNKLLTHLDAEKANSLLIARRYYQKLGEQSLVGWDYARYISLCRWGYVAGYLSEDEAWQRIIYAARILQRTFGSWREFGENYLIGREFWSLAQTQKDGQAMRAAYERLLSNSSSPWNRISWTLALQ